MTSTIKDTRKHTYQLVVSCEVYVRGEGLDNADVLDVDAGEITTTGPIPAGYLEDLEYFDGIIDNLPETARQHGGDISETLWIISAYELDKNGEPAEEPDAQSKRWECELWEHFYPDAKF